VLQPLYCWAKDNIACTSNLQREVRMTTRKIQQALNTLVEYFEAGNSESDASAKAILLADSRYDEYWHSEIDKLQKSYDWTGLRGPEAELLAGLLRQATELIADPRT